MPRHSRNEIKAGAFILAAFALLCIGIYIIADFGTLFREKKLHYFSFDKVEGLGNDDDVMYAGIKCGSVKDIRFEECEDRGKIGEAKTRVLVTVEIDANVPIRDKDKPKITRGLTGNVYMDIVPFARRAADESLGAQLVTTREKPLVGHHYPSLEELSEDVQQLLRQVQGQLATVDQTLQNVEGATANAKAITERVRDSVARHEAEVDQILANANKTSQNVEGMTSELRPEVKAAVSDARATLAEARQTATEARTKINEMFPKVNEMLDKLNEAATNVREASTDARAATSDVRVATAEAKEIIVGNRANIDGTIEELRQSSARLNIAMEDIRRSPWKLLSRNIVADAYTQNIYDASMSFAEGARALSMASGNLQALLAQPDADEAAVKEASEKVNRLVGEMAKLQDLLYEALKKRPQK